MSDVYGWIVEEIGGVPDSSQTDVVTLVLLSPAKCPVQMSVLLLQKRFSVDERESSQNLYLKASRNEDEEAPNFGCTNTMRINTCSVDLVPWNTVVLPRWGSSVF